MYDIVKGIINHNTTGTFNPEQYIYYISGSLIIILTVVFIDMVYRIFRNWVKF